MVPANDIASVIIARNGPWLDAMRLQKLLYYVQAWHVAVTDSPLFSEPIKAWRDGPVVPQVRTARADQSTRRAADQDLDNIRIDDFTSNLIDLVSIAYGNMSGDELSALTHVEAPWIEARGDLAEGEHGRNPIELQKMAAFYRAHRTLGGRTAADLAVGGLHVLDRSVNKATDVDALLESLGEEYDTPGQNLWGGANLDCGESYDDSGIETGTRRSYAGS